MANSGAWKPGQSGNPGGRSKKNYAIKELAQAKTEVALAALERVMSESDDDKAVVSAAMGILAYGYGRPAQQIDLTNSDGSLSQAWQAAVKSVDNDESSEAPVQH